MQPKGRRFAKRPAEMGGRMTSPYWHAAKAGEPTIIPRFENDFRLGRYTGERLNRIMAKLERRGKGLLSQFKKKYYKAIRARDALQHVEKSGIEIDPVTKKSKETLRSECAYELEQFELFCRQIGFPGPKTI